MRVGGDEIIKLLDLIALQRIKNDPASFVTDVQDATAVTPVKETPGLLRRVFRLK